MSDKKPLDRIKQGTMARTMALARLTVSAGARAASHAVGSVFSGEEGRAERAKALLQAQLSALATEFGQLKGSAMKAGQLLSMYGEQFLPPEANAILKSLQNQSPPMSWSAIAKVLDDELPPPARASLQVDETPLAAASLGQVHRGTVAGRPVAVKVQYPGVEAAIAADLRALRGMVTLSRLLPKNLDADGFFAEIKRMLEQEADYTQERHHTEVFGRLLADDARFIVPTPVPELCSRHVLTTSFEEGLAPDSAEVKGLPQARRNAIGVSVLDLYMRELWEFGQVQTDPHFGNYRVRLGRDGAPDRLVVLDFGAVRAVPPSYLEGYRDLVVGSCGYDAAQVCRGGERLGFLGVDDEPGMRELFVDICFMITEPFQPTDRVAPEARHFIDATGAYDWGHSDLPKRLAKKGTQAALTFKLRAPPRESVFLDRKLGGVFIFLSVLQVNIRGRDVLQRYLPV